MTTFTMPTYRTKLGDTVKSHITVDEDATIEHIELSYPEATFKDFLKDY